MLAKEFNQEDIQQLKEIIQRNDSDVKPLSIAVPGIVMNRKAHLAHELVTACSPDNEAWLPEALALFNTENLDAEQKREMVEALFSKGSNLNQNQVEMLSDLSARIGRYGFSFPQWRFTSQGMGGASLIEHFGLTRLQRDNDVRSPDLPKWNPQRDEYGIGFVWHGKQWSIEHRRAYVLISNRSLENPTTVVIRNSSYFFGRDRLEAPCYISFAPLSTYELERIDKDMLTASHKFMPFQDVLQKSPQESHHKKLLALETILNFMDEFEARLSLWLMTSGKLQKTSQFEAINNAFGQTDGLKTLIDFSEAALKAQQNRGSDAVPFYLVDIESAMPPWAPRKAVLLSDDTLYELKIMQRNPLLLKSSSNLKQLFANVSVYQRKLVLLSGPKGDFPVQEKTPKNNHSKQPRPA